MSRDGVPTDDEKVTKVRHWPTPRSTSEVKTFLGFAVCYGRFIQGFAEISASPTSLSSKRQQFQWSTKEEKAFEELKRRLCEAPVLAYPRFDVEFRLKTDAIAQAVGAVLTQLEKGAERPVAFASRTLNATERNYCTTARNACDCMGHKSLSTIPLRP